MRARCTIEPGRRAHARAGLFGLGLGVLVLAGPTAVFAQPPGAGGGWLRPQAGPGESERAAKRALRREERERLHGEVLDQMRAMRMWKLTQELKLDQSTAAKVFPLLAEYDTKARDLTRERFKIAREVYEQTRDGRPDNRRLAVLIDGLLTNQARRKTLEEDRFKALRPALTPLQQAKLLLLLPRLEDDFRRRIRDAMNEQRRLRMHDKGGDETPSPQAD